MDLFGTLRPWNVAGKTLMMMTILRIVKSPRTASLVPKPSKRQVVSIMDMPTAGVYRYIYIYGFQYILSGDLLFYLFGGHNIAPHNFILRRDSGPFSSPSFEGVN